MLSAQTLETIKSTVPLLEVHGRAITDVFYEKLFFSHPCLKNIFNMANQGKGEQSRALSDAVLAYAKHIDQVEVLLPVVQRIAHKHVSLGIQAKHYSIVGENLLAAIQDVLSLSDDHPALAAWAEAYEVLANIFIQVEEDIYQSNQQQAGGWKGYRDFYIDRIVVETPDVKSFYFKPMDLEEVSSGNGGQYIGVRVRPNGCGHYQIRQYSLSQKGCLRISVKSEGVVSNYLHNCQEGDAVSLQSPTGVFTLGDRQSKHIFIAGGVGITPLMSMIQEAIDQSVAAENILLVQCAKDEEHQIFARDLANLKAKHGFHHQLCYKNSSHGAHQGHLNQAILAQWTKERGFMPTNAQVYFCGPKSFMAMLNQSFLGMGYDTLDIHYEVFGPTNSL